jgi:hypothetical protein
MFGGATPDKQRSGRDLRCGWQITRGKRRLARPRLRRSLLIPPILVMLLWCYLFYAPRSLPCPSDPLDRALHPLRHDAAARLVSRCAAICDFSWPLCKVRPNIKRRLLRPACSRFPYRRCNNAISSSTAAEKLMMGWTPRLQMMRGIRCKHSDQRGLRSI